MTFPKDPATLRLIAQISDLQSYSMPEGRANSIEVAEQREQWRELAYLCLGHLLERATTFNAIAPVTDKLKLGEFSDVVSDAFDEVVGQFNKIEHSLEEEEQAA